MNESEEIHGRHEFDDDGCCIHCGFDGAEWHWWKHSTYEGKAQPNAKRPQCLVNGLPRTSKNTANGPRT